MQYTSSVSTVSCFVRERRRTFGDSRAVIHLAKLPNVRGRSRTQMLTERTAYLEKGTYQL